jgi:hypothetical protein
MRPAFAILISVVICLGALAATYFVMLGGVLSHAKHDWRVEVSPKLAGPWSVDVPRLVAHQSDSLAPSESLTALLATLHVESGKADFRLSGDSLRIEGDGADAVVLRASRTLDRGADEYQDWGTSETNASRAHDGAGPVIDVTWSVDFSPGVGPGCRAKETLTAQLPPGQVRPMLRAKPPVVDEGEVIPMWTIKCT